MSENPLRQLIRLSVHVLLFSLCQGFVLTEDGEDAGYEATTAGATMAVRLRGGVKFAGVSYLRHAHGETRSHRPRSVTMLLLTASLS